MKCLRCGKEVNDDIKYCENCGFDVQSQKNYQVVYQESDPVVEKNKKMGLIDFPILTFLFGLLSIMNSFLLALGGKPIVIMFVISFALLFGFCFYFSTKPCKVKLKPFREVGIILAFIGLFITLASIISALLF